MKDSKFRVVYKRPNEEAHVVDYSSVEEFNLEEIQFLVEGNFEVTTVSIGDMTLTVYCNEEALLEHMEANIVHIFEDKVIGCIAGPIIIVSNELDHGVETTLKDKELENALIACSKLDVNSSEETRAIARRFNKWASSNF